VNKRCADDASRIKVKNTAYICVEDDKYVRNMNNERHKGPDQRRKDENKK